MILYTPLSETDIFPTELKDYQKRQTVQVDGRIVELEQIEEGSYRVVQLLSTNPQDYLNQSLHPGEIISI
ncbi:YlzJ-like family protein [Aquibacillus albus]|uniref:Uncharacterized protein n=1 Tax=Aquibacillus albus TaxID=1168171 RepID=A0ABS2N1R9_9BACI|nr:YlzJ-like family protein [Aquibacillus albus]MBM7572082.1 hypothetical protein [Aquibacillus albus]